LTRKFAVRQAKPCNEAHNLCKSHRIGQLATERIFPIIESERLLMHIAEQVKRLNCNVGSTEATLQTAPKVFDTLNVNLPVNILLKMVHELTLILGFKSRVTSELIRHNRGAGFNKIAHRSMHCGVLAICDDSGFHWSATLQSCDDHRLAVSALHSNGVTHAAAPTLVPVPRSAADGTFV